MFTSFGHASLRRIFKVGAVGLFLVILLMGSISLLKIGASTRLSQDILHHSINEMHHTMLLRIAATEAEMPVNDYIIHAGQGEQALYRKLRAEVEKQFDYLARMPGFLPGQVMLLDDARQQWNRAQQVAEVIMAIENPVGSSFAAERMEEYDKLVDDSSQALKQLYDAVYTESLGQGDEVLHIERQTVGIIIGLFLAALALVAYAIIWLPRVLFPPVRDVSRGMQAISQGNLDYRVGNNVALEFVSLTEGFNDMAEQLGRDRQA